jgi:predicted nucleotidyltransferase
MKNKILETLRRRLEKKKAENCRQCTAIREHLPDIIEIIAAFKVEKIVLFGSVTKAETFNEFSDIDIGLIGLDKKKDFFPIYSRLSERVPWKIDLVDLDDDHTFKEMVLQKGELVYDRRNRN